MRSTGERPLVPALQLGIDARHMKTPLAELFADTEVYGDLGGSFSCSTQFHQAIAWNQKSSAKPISLLFLFVGIIAEKEQARLGNFDASRSVAQFNVRKLVHQVGSLTGWCVGRIHDNCKFAVHLDGHGGPAVGIVYGELALRLLGQRERGEVEHGNVQTDGIPPRVQRGVGPQAER